MLNASVEFILAGTASTLAWREVNKSGTSLYLERKNGSELPGEKNNAIPISKPLGEKVDAKNPRIVCVNQSELDQARSLLENLGIDASQLGFCTHGDQHTPWLESVALKHAGTTHSENRASRGSQRVLVTEVSIAVKQKAGQQVPDGRDFHRALIALCVAISVL